jgi:hypothetical protein
LLISLSLEVFFNNFSVFVFDKLFNLYYSVSRVLLRPLGGVIFMTVGFYYSILPFVPLSQKWGVIFISGPGMYSQTGQVIFVPEWPKGEFVSILASFCVWTKSLVCNDAPQGFYYSEMLQSKKIFSSLSAVRTIEPSLSDDYLSLFHPSGRRAIPSGLQTDQPSSVWTTCLSVQTLHCVEKVLSSLHPTGHFRSTSRRLSVFEQSHISFQVQIKGRSINLPDDVVSRPDACLLKARIAIQISPSG